MSPKKLTLILVALILGALAPLGAEQKVSPFFVKNVPVSKVTMYQEGYLVNYFGNGFKIKNLYLPIQWFSLTAGYKTEDGKRKAELFYGNGAEYPYLSIYWKNGKFHHIVLWVRKDYNDPTWGATDPTAKVSAKFNPDADPEFTF